VQRFVGTFFVIFEPLPAANPLFAILEHPADIGFRAFGATLEQLFENAALALVSIASEVADVEPRQEYFLEATGSDTESLLVAWLSEVLYFFDGRRIGFRGFRVTEIHPQHVAGMGFGEPRDSSRHGARLIVKAVTWHQLRVWQEQGQWIAQVYLDV
jgi:SHS2 domain-containing protein